MNQRIIVAAILCKDNKILLGKKAKGARPYPDVWHILGGGASDQKKAARLVLDGKYDDSYFHEEVQREVFEEGRVTIKNIRNICPEYREKPREMITDNKEGEKTHYIFLEYFCEYESGEEKPGDDIAELKWVDKREISKINVTKPSEEMYRELGWIS